MHITQLIKADLPNLQVLDLSRNPLTPAAVEQLVQGDWQSLTWLNLANTFFQWCTYQREAEAIAAVVWCQHLADSDWPALTALNLRKNSLSTAALAQLVKADWPMLQELDISFNQLQRGTGFMHQLAQAPWTALQELNISSNMLGVKDAMQLGRLGCKPLTRLNIARCFRHLEAADVTQAMRHFAAGEWPELKALNVSGNSLSSEAIAELAKGAWPELQSLDASFNELQWQPQLEGRPGFVQALGMASWTALQHLNLSCNALNAEDARFLGQLDWPQLKSLDVRDCFCASGHCTVSAMPNFAASDWPQLTTLDVRENLFGKTIMCDMLRGARLDYLRLGGNEVVSWARSVSPGWDHLGSLDLQGSPWSPEDICTLLGSCSHAFNTLHISCQVDWPTQARPSASSWPPCTVLDMTILASVAVLDSLSSGHWPAQSVSLRRTKEDRASPRMTAELQALVRCNFNVMESLCLRDIGLGIPQAMPGVVQVLCQGDWPKLHRLDLSLNFLESGSEQILVQANWPELVELDLSSNSFDPEADARAYIVQHWPHVSLSSFSDGVERDMLRHRSQRNLSESLIA